MPITTVSIEPDHLTMTLVADVAAPRQKLWEVFADPRQVERIWGPPDFPARFTRHDFFPGGRSDYAMRGAEGDLHPGFWEFHAVTDGESFEVIDGFANSDGTLNTTLPTSRARFEFSTTATGSQVRITSTFETAAQLEQLLAMGAEQGLREAMDQLDAVLADDENCAPNRRCEAEILSDTHVRVARIVEAPLEDVWRAHHDADLLQQWLLGPDGWTMPVCEVATNVGETYRYVWESRGGSAQFGFTGTLIESTPPRRSVTTERMTDNVGPSTINELTLTPIEAGTLLSLVITYPNAKVRDLVLNTGMADGMEASYVRLANLLRQAQPPDASPQM